MTVRFRNPGSRIARAPMALALLALVLQLMFPTGFMAAAPASGHGIPIVICTAQGAVTIDWDGQSGRHDKQAPAKPMAHCAFAGHATAAPPPLPQAPAIPVAFQAPVPATQPYAVFQAGAWPPRLRPP